MKRKALFIALLLILAAAQVQAGNMLVSAYSRTLLEMINEYRMANGLNTLRQDPTLTGLAQQHSFKMFKQKRMGHSGFKERFARSGSRLCVENVGWKYNTPQKEFDAWRHSRGHDENMLAEGVRRAGIAKVGDYVTFFACK